MSEKGEGENLQENEMIPSLEGEILEAIVNYLQAYPLREHPTLLKPDHNMELHGIIEQAIAEYREKYGHKVI